MSNKSQIFYFNILIHTFIVLKTVLKAHFIKSLTFEITLLWSTQELQKLPFHFLHVAVSACATPPPVFLEYTVASSA